MLVLSCMLPAGKAGAADDTVKTPTPTPTPIQDYVNKEQYLNGYYRGYINSDSATVYAGPGTKAFPKVTLDDGTVVTLTKNTEVFVWGETKDVDLDPWYHITAVFKDKEIEGYIYKPRVTRENTQILFTPTPTPEPTPTEVPVLPTDVPDEQISPIPPHRQFFYGTQISQIPQIFYRTQESQKSQKVPSARIIFLWFP